MYALVFHKCILSVYFGTVYKNLCLTLYRIEILCSVLHVFLLYMYMQV